VTAVLTSRTIDASHLRRQMTLATFGFLIWVYTICLKLSIGNSAKDGLLAFLLLVRNALWVA